jgi:hypothetical protein
MPIEARWTPQPPDPGPEGTASGCPPCDPANRPRPATDRKPPASATPPPSPAARSPMSPATIPVRESRQGGRTDRPQIGEARELTDWVAMPGVGDRPATSPTARIPTGTAPAHSHCGPAVPTASFGEPARGQIVTISWRELPVLADCSRIYRRLRVDRRGSVAVRGWNS